MTESASSSTDDRPDAGRSRPKVARGGAGGSRGDAVRTPADFAELAKRIRNRTVDIVVIAIVAAAGLSLAGWVSEWWRNDPANLSASPGALPPAPWESPEGVALRFGDQPWTMHRRQLVGDVEIVTAELRESCREIVEQPIANDELSQPDEAERNLLASLESFPAADQRPGDWAIYEIGGFLPWVIGVKESSAVEGARTDQQSRVICWAMALPQPDGSWVVHTIHRHGGGSAAREAGTDVTLPPWMRPSLRLADSGGSSLTCFSGVGETEQWSGELTAAWSRDGWRIVRGWSVSGSARSAVFSRVTDEGERQTAEFVLSDTGGGEGMGTIIITTESVPADGTSEAP